MQWQWSLTILFSKSLLHCGWTWTNSLKQKWHLNVPLCSLCSTSVRFLIGCCGNVSYNYFTSYSHCVKRVQIRNFSDLHFLVFGLNTGNFGREKPPCQRKILYTVLTTSTFQWIKSIFIRKDAVHTTPRRNMCVDFSTCSVKHFCSVLI